MNWNFAPLWRLVRRQEGTAAVEFVLILPLLTLVLFGTIEIGRLLQDYHVVTKSVRDATRYLTRMDGVSIGLDGTNCTINESSTPVIEAKNLALTGTIDGSGDYLLPYWTNPSTISITPSCFDNNGGTYQGFFLGTSTIFSLTMGADVPVPLMNGWLLGQDNTLTFTIEHKEVHFGQ